VKVFISWSGEPSRSIARVLASWLGSVVQAIDPWISDEEIRSGDRWNNEIAKALDETNFGIICITKTNQSSSWLLFEAGALAKSLEKGSVVPVCIDLPPSDVTGPLAAFQGRRLNQDGIKRLVHDLNEASDKPISKEQLDALFTAMWPNLETAIGEAVEQTPSGRPTELDSEPERTAEDMLGELIERVRGLERDRGETPLTADGKLATLRWLVEHDKSLSRDDSYEIMRQMRAMAGIDNP
jgi:TIR domain